MTNDLTTLKELGEDQMLTMEEARAFHTKGLITDGDLARIAAYHLACVTNG